MQLVALTLENRMLLHADDDIQIAWRTAMRARLALPGETQSRSVVDARRNVHLELAITPDVPLAFALRARPPDDLAPTIALAAGPPDLQKALLIDHLAAAAAHR